MEARMHRLPVGRSLITAAILLIGCSSSATMPPTSGLLALGMWGGDSTGMIVGDTALHLHIACTYGDVSGRVPVDASGHFDVVGSYLLRAFPVAIGPTVPARFVGQLNGKTLVVTVTVNDTIRKTTVVRGPVTLTFGQTPRDMPCPICRRPVLTRQQLLEN
jgi:hypothetical protein